MSTSSSIRKDQNSFSLRKTLRSLASTLDLPLELALLETLDIIKMRRIDRLIFLLADRVKETPLTDEDKLHLSMLATYIARIAHMD